MSRVYDAVEARNEAPDLNSYDIVAISSSGGKDSQVMLDEVVAIADQQGFPREQLVVLHADLGRAEWEGVRELVEEQAKHYGLRVEVAKRWQDIPAHVEYRWEQFQARADRFEIGFEALTKEDWIYVKARAKAAKLGKPTQDLLGSLAAKDRGNPCWPMNNTRFCTSEHKTQQNSKTVTRLAQEFILGLAEKARNNPCWPANNTRYCTSQHKVAECSKILTQLVKDARKDHGPVRILECLGLRAEESRGRAICKACKGQGRTQRSGKTITKAYKGRTIACVKCEGSGKRLSLENNKSLTNTRKHVDTWLPVHEWTEGEVWARIHETGIRHHEAYDLGMPRLSCVFCFFAPKSALKIAGHHNLDTLKEYARIETKIGKTFTQDLSMADLLTEIEAEKAAGIDTTTTVSSDDAAGWDM